MPVNTLPPPHETPPPFPPPEGAGIHRLVIILTALVVLFSGIVVGVGLTVLYLERAVPGAPGTPEQAARLVIDRIDGSVALNPEERRLTEDLVKRHMAELSAIRGRYAAETMQKLGDMNRGLTKIIGPERMSRCGNLLRFHHGHPTDGPGGAPGKGHLREHGCRGGEDCAME